MIVIKAVNTQTEHYLQYKNNLEKKYNDKIIIHRPCETINMPN